MVAVDGRALHCIRIAAHIWLKIANHVRVSIFERCLEATIITPAGGESAVWLELSAVVVCVFAAAQRQNLGTITSTPNREKSVAGGVSEHLPSIFIIVVGVVICRVE